jgi:aspartyl protease family protein
MLAGAAQAQAVWVRLVGLGPGRAELQINQAPVRVMRPGETSPEGVRLLSVTMDYAQVEANGAVHRLTLGQRIEPMVVLQADGRGHYGAEAIINGRSVAAMVDTGATTVALNRSDADRLGLSYRQGRMIKMRTASGETDAYLITLDQVQLGPILLRNVEATVSVLADSPPYALLGMSFLRRLDMATDGNRLRLMYLK